jgi:hypothetical protein
MSEEEIQLHRKMGVDLFNYTWELLDKPTRSRAEDDTMLHAAHASRYHWGIAGAPVNLARGEWQVSRVYAVLGRSEPALYHAQRSLDICLENQIGDFDLAFAYEALARASAVAGKSADYEKYLSQAKQASQQIAEKEDREVFDNDLATIHCP